MQLSCFESFALSGSLCGALAQEGREGQGDIFVPKALVGAVDLQWARDPRMGRAG